jgi:glycosyltransferase involved in cell wall biosynthesis
VHIDGLEWTRGKWSRPIQWFLKYSERVAIKYADVIIADNGAISQYVNIQYNKECSQIAYGGDHVMARQPKQFDRQQYGFLEQEYAFAVCRIEPENNIMIILNAFCEVRSLRLVVVGNWVSSSYGRLLKKRYENYSHMTLLDPIYCQEKLDLLRSNAYVYIHGHQAGGTNPSLVEAMSLHLPIIAFNVVYNCNVTQNKAIYFKDTKELIAILKGIRKRDLKAVADLMLEIATQSYVWRIVSDQYKEVLR